MSSSESGDIGATRPPPPLGVGNYVPRAEYEQLVQRVGGVEEALQSMSTNFTYLSRSVTKFMGQWDPYAPHNDG